MGPCLAQAHLEGVCGMFLAYPCALAARCQTEPSPESREARLPFRRNKGKDKQVRQAQV